MRVAVCVWGELRGVMSDAILDSFYEHLVTPLDADVFICAQRQFKDDDARLDRFTKRVVKKELYEKPDPEQYFGGDCFQRLRDRVKDNWSSVGNTQQYINFHKYHAFLTSCNADYDMYVFVRSDFQYLFPFPSHSILDRSHIYTYTGHTYGGINYTLIAVPKADLRTYLLGPHTCITGVKCWNFKSMNSETFMRIVFEQNKLLSKVRYIRHNAFLSAETDVDRTTWGPIQKSSEHQVLYKYKEQLEEAYKSYGRWTDGQGKQWKIERNTFEVV